MIHPHIIVANAGGASRHSGSRSDTGWLARVCRWVAALAGANADAARTAEIQIAALTPQTLAIPVADQTFRCHLVDCSADNVLSFPETEWSLLTRLARVVRSQCGALAGDEINAVSLRIAGGVPLKLWIDRTAYAEIASSGRTYRVVLGANLPTCISLETSDFEEASGFIRDYVLATGFRLDAGDRA